ncbi:MAG TPA: T9SS type A sorting domain-containing protein [candidate division Zixibacteria bacterium]|nr:T9SS type A sorting domain-containing protein [candidate division Zixibacteria bacterium]
MTIDFTEGADSSRILVYSLDGNSMPSGNYSFVQLHSDSDVEILSIEAASSDGVLALVENRAKEVVIPTSFELSQNYPNPFNPETNISFSLPNQTDLTLEIFNILGKKVRVLIDDTFAAGHHVVMWDGRNDTGVEVASGVYFYRIQTETNFQTKKMLFLK